MELCFKVCQNGGFENYCFLETKSVNECLNINNADKLNVTITVY